MSQFPSPNNPPPDGWAAVLTEGIKHLRNQPLLFGVLFLAVLGMTIVPLSGLGSENQRLFLTVVAFLAAISIMAYVVVQVKNSPLRSNQLLQNSTHYLEGYVYFTSNEPVRNARVYGVGVIEEGITNNLGAFRVLVKEAMSWELFAEYNQAKSAVVQVTKGSDLKNIILKIESPEMMVKGTVVSHQGSLVRGAIITVDGVRHSTISDQNGFFEIKVPSQNQWVIRYSFNDLTQEQFVTPADLENLRLVFKNNTLPQVMIKGTVLSHDGRVENGAIITVDGFNLSATSNQNGYFELTVPQQNNWVIRYKLGNLTKERTLTPADLENLRLVFEPPQPIEPNGEPLPSTRTEAEIQAILNDRIELKNWLLKLDSSELDELIFELGISSAHLSGKNHAQRVLDLLGYVQRHGLSERFKAICEKKLRNG